MTGPNSDLMQYFIFIFATYFIITVFCIVSERLITEVIIKLVKFFFIDLESQFFFFFFDEFRATKSPKLFGIASGTQWNASM